MRHRSTGNGASRHLFFRADQFKLKFFEIAGDIINNLEFFQDVQAGLAANKQVFTVFGTGSCLWSKPY
jgi:hypothetical protein